MVFLWWERQAALRGTVHQALVRTQQTQETSASPLPIFSWLGWGIAFLERLERVVEKFGQVRPGAAAAEGRKRKRQIGLVFSGAGVLDGSTVVRGVGGQYSVTQLCST